LPGETFEATLMLAVEEPDPGAAICVGLKVTLMPEGAAAERATAELKPPKTAVVMVDDPLLPTFTESDEGEAEMVKEGVCVVVPVRAASRPVFGLPQPVTRSYPVTAE
jgi:hypothetical protein